MPIYLLDQSKHLIKKSFLLLQKQRLPAKCQAQSSCLVGMSWVDKNADFWIEIHWLVQISLCYILAYLILHKLHTTLPSGTHSLGQRNPLEKGMKTHSSRVAWRIPQAEEPGGLQSVHGVVKSWTILRVRMGKTRDLFKKIRDTKGHFMQRWAR